MRIASLYLTEPVSDLPQPPYLNTALTGATRHAPEDLMSLVKYLEWRAGRRTGPRFGPRPLDIDILLYGNLQVRSPALTIPHPELRKRSFYLVPLCEIAPDLRVPPDGSTVAELAALPAAGGAT